MCIWAAADKLDEANVLPVATIPSSVCALAQPSSPGRTLLRADLPSRRPLSPLSSMRALALSLSFTLFLSLLLDSLPTRPFSVSLSRSLSGSLSVLLAAARSSEHRNAHYRLPFVSGIWHNFLAGRERDKSVNKRHKTAARTDNAAQNRLSSPAARWNGHCLRGCGAGCAKVAGGRHCRLPACLINAYRVTLQHTHLSLPSLVRLKTGALHACTFAGSIRFGLQFVTHRREVRECALALTITIFELVNRFSFIVYIVASLWIEYKVKYRMIFFTSKIKHGHTDIRTHGHFGTQTYILSQHQQPNRYKHVHLSVSLSVSLSLSLSVSLSVRKLRLSQGFQI